MPTANDICKLKERVTYKLREVTHFVEGLRINIQEEMLSIPDEKDEDWGKLSETSDALGKILESLRRIQDDALKYYTKKDLYALVNSTRDDLCKLRDENWGHVNLPTKASFWILYVSTSDMEQVFCLLRTIERATANADMLLVDPQFCLNP